MSDLRTRGPEGTLQARVFRLLRARGSFAADTIAAELDAPYESCRKACGYLRDRGLVEKRQPFGQRVFYRALPGKAEPRDRRGKRASSRNHRGAVAWAKWLAMMQRKHGPQWRPPVRGATTLEQIWRMP